MMFWQKNKSLPEPIPDLITDPVKEPVTEPQEIPVPPEPPTASFLARSINFLKQIIEERLNQHFKNTTIANKPAFEIYSDGSMLADYVVESKMGLEEFLTVLLALAPHTYPDLFTDLIKIYLPKGGDFPEFGGVRGTNFRGIIPTGETALFVLAGTNIDRRLEVANLLKGEITRSSINEDVNRKTVFQDGTILLEPVKDGEPEMSGRLLLSQEKVSEFLTGKRWKPKFGTTFPASLLDSKMDWEDIILPASTQKDLSLIKFWLENHEIIDSDKNLGKRIKPGYRALFYGAPGTGKTITATLLGKQYDVDVFRIDLSMIVSKYIGETEKNLQQVFDIAANKKWILFFDEADALFGKRTNVQSAHDRFANQEISYLLQKVEEHPGLIILASNFKNNMDQAFIRRFQAVVHFTLPNEKERLLLWENTLPSSIEVEKGINFKSLARNYELSGASILNIIHSACIRALYDKRPISEADLLEEIQNEYMKNGKSI